MQPNYHFANIPEALCQAHVERVAGSETFLRADQLRRLLRWLGERSTATPRCSPSEKEIAEAVLNRKDFDPQSDSLVRKEMSRLREKLSRFYLLEGSREDLRIVTGGGYLLNFEWRAPFLTRGERPCCLVLPFRTSAEMNEVSDEFLEEIMSALSEQGELDLVAPTTALGYRGRSGDIREFAAECRASLVVEGSLRRKNDAVIAAVWLVDGQNGIAERSIRITGHDINEVARHIAEWLLLARAKPPAPASIPSIPVVSGVNGRHQI